MPCHERATVPETDRPDRPDRLPRRTASSAGSPRRSAGRSASTPSRPGRPARPVLDRAADHPRADLPDAGAHWVQKSPCQDGDWQKNVQYTRFCYTDVLALYYAEGLNEGKVPYRDHPVEYPVVTGYFMGALGLPVHALRRRSTPRSTRARGSTTPTRWSSRRLAVATAAVILALRRRRPWDAAIFALSPILLVTATVNWDFLAIGLAAFGLYAWAKTLAGPGRRAARPRRARRNCGRCSSSARCWSWRCAPRRLSPVLHRHRRGASSPGSWSTSRSVLLPRELAAASSSSTRERPIDWGTLWYVGRYLDGKWNTGAPGDQGPFQWLSDHVPHPQLPVVRPVRPGLRRRSARCACSPRAAPGWPSSRSWWSPPS